MLSDKSKQALEKLSPERRRELLNAYGRKLGGHALVAEALKRCGIRNLSGMTGTPVNEIFGEAAKKGIRLFGTRHQFAATMMAATENHLSDCLRHAVCISAGPAVTNTVTGILHAYQNNLPLLVLGSSRALQGEGRGQFQEFNAVPLMRPITKFAITVPSARDIMPIIHKACAVAINGVPGPVYVDLPEDVLYASTSPTPLKVIEREYPPTADPSIAKEALRHLRSSERPLLCLGEGLRSGFDQRPILDLVTQENLPFITTPMGRGLLSDDHPNCVNTVRYKAMQRTDLLILAGARLDWRFRLGAAIGPHTQVIHAHPDENELGMNAADHVAYLADPMDFLRKLSTGATPDVPHGRSNWMEELQNMIREHGQPVEPGKSNLPGFADSVLAMTALRDALPDDALIVLDASIHLSIAQHVLKAKKPLSWLDPGQCGLIGGGIPMAMGAQCAHPDRPVVAIVGDTGFGMSGLDFETATRHHLPIKVMVMNNSGISGMHRQRQFLPPDYPESFSQFQEALPYEAVAEAMGAKGHSISSNQEVPLAIENMLSSKSAYCLNVHVDPESPFPPTW